jgi:pimeloyl-ACP methyl ester carboxylesterase
MYRSRRPASSETLTLRGIRHHLWRWGPPANPPVVLLHGWADTGETFQFVVDCLPDHWSLAALDWRGFGRSAHAPGGAYWFPDYVADLDALLEALSPDRPARIVGHSLGANALSLYGGARPERLERIALLDGFGLADMAPAAAPERYRRWLEQLRGAPPRFASYASFEVFAGFLARRNPRLTPERAAFIARAWGEERAGRIAIRSDPAHKLIYPVLYRRAETEACWRNITVPVLLMLGGRSEYVGPDVDARSLAATFHRATAVTLPDCGHMLHHEDPQGVAAALVQFFQDRG